jgi:hypothetical protein
MSNNRKRYFFRKFSKHKRAMELSINFIVLMILGIAMLAGSIMLVNKVFLSAKTYKATVDAQTNEQIRKLITSGDDLVVVYPDRMRVNGGETGVFAVGVQNTLQDPSFDDNYCLEIMFSSAVTSVGKTDICSEDNGKGVRECKIIDAEKHADKDIPEPWLVYNAGPLNIPKNKVGTFAVNINPAKAYPSGLYAFNVKVYKGDSCTGAIEVYGGVQKMYVQKV